MKATPESYDKKVIMSSLQSLTVRYVKGYLRQIITSDLVCLAPIVS